MGNFMIGIIVGLFVGVWWAQGNELSRAEQRLASKIEATDWGELRSDKSPVHVVMLTKKDAAGLRGDVAELVEQRLQEQFRKSRAPVTLISQRSRPADFAKVEEVIRSE